MGLGTIGEPWFTCYKSQSSLSKSDLVSETRMSVAIPMAAPTPYPPGEEEQNFDYFGPPSRPKLVARNSGIRWQPQFRTGFQIRKVLKNLGNYPIVDQYNDNVIEEIINVLGDFPWNAIDVLRIEYDSEDPTKYPVILWMSVQPGSTREAEIFDLAGPRLLRLEPQYSCIYERLPLIQTLGQSLARIDQPELEGSMGLYLKQNNGNKYFGLTCRHCYSGGRHCSLCAEE